MWDEEAALPPMPLRRVACRAVCTERLMRRTRMHAIHSSRPLSIEEVGAEREHEPKADNAYKD